MKAIGILVVSRALNSTSAARPSNVAHVSKRGPKDLVAFEGLILTWLSRTHPQAQEHAPRSIGALGFYFSIPKEIQPLNTTPRRHIGVWEAHY